MNQASTLPTVDKFVRTFGVDDESYSLAFPRSLRMTDRRNIQKMLVWCRENPSIYEGFERAFNIVISILNLQLDKLEDDIKFPMINKLKTYLNGQLIPDINEITEGQGGLSIFNFRDAISEMNEEMTEGERIADGGEKVTDIYLKYHTVEKGHEARLAGSFFHFFDTFVRQRFTNVPRELICDALIEALCLIGSTNALFDPIVNPNRLNWVIPYSTVFYQPMLDELAKFYTDEG